MQIELNNVYNMDCLEGLRQMADKSVDLIVTDPPYVLETQGGGLYTKEDKQYVKELADIKDGFNEAVLDECCRVLKKINIYLWCSQKQIIPYLDYFVRERGCNWNLLCWHKTNPVPACGNKYVNDTEFCLFFREKGVKLYGNFDTKATYFVRPINVEDKELWHHPTIKPLNIIKSLIINSSVGGGTVLDPFMGSGTTAVACQQLGRQFVGFELNADYHKTCQQRIELEKRTLRLF